MGVVWLRCYPKQVVLAYLFGVSETSVLRIINRVLPLLEQSVTSGHPHHQRNHTARVVAVCGLANRRLARRYRSKPIA